MSINPYYRSRSTTQLEDPDLPNQRDRSFCPRSAESVDSLDVSGHGSPYVGTRTPFSYHTEGGFPPLDPVIGMEIEVPHYVRPIHHLVQYHQYQDLEEEEEEAYHQHRAIVAMEEDQVLDGETLVSEITGTIGVNNIAKPKEVSVVDKPTEVSLGQLGQDSQRGQSLVDQPVLDQPSEQPVIPQCHLSTIKIPTPVVVTSTKNMESPRMSTLTRTTTSHQLGTEE